MKTITAQKSFEEILEVLERTERVYIVGCGTCATMCQTGGEAQVLQMKERLEQAGKIVTGWMVIPTACDDLTKEALGEQAEGINQAQGILVMACAFGVQTVVSWTDKPVCPALNTLFIGKEDVPYQFSEVCIQCGECILGWTAGICPVTSCTKGLLNGPCGGTKKGGKCEIDKEKDCAWVLIYQRLESQDRLDLMRKYKRPKDYRVVKRPGRIKLSEDLLKRSF
ncbi:TPA: 5,10-methylenetetrahydrofolate reductase [bacterium]|nr:5,10-methylenetetrahydrofolate reductase [bacterium]